MELHTLLIIVAVMAVIQISLWMSIPIGIREFFFANPFLAFIANMIGSMFIVGFTGIASLVGTANLAASVIFILYVIYYNKKHKIIGLKVKWLRIFWIIPIIPIFGVNKKENNNVKNKP